MLMVVKKGGDICIRARKREREKKSSGISVPSEKTCHGTEGVNL